MKEQVLVLGVSHYKFPDEQTGEIKEGAHVTYLSDYEFDESGKKGCFPVKISVPTKSFIAVMEEQFPAICDLEIKTIPDGRGKPKSTVTAIEYLQKVNVFAAV
jgi:hypothetical protein